MFVWRKYKRTAIVERHIHSDQSKKSFGILYFGFEKSVMGSGKERDTFVYLAKLSEQAERYEGKESSSSLSRGFSGFLVIRSFS